MPGPLWEMTDHVCRVCMGRILRRPDPDTGGTVVRCSNCGIEAIGTNRALCCCGLTLKQGADAKLRCVRQDRPTPEFPGEIVVAEVG